MTPDERARQKQAAISKNRSRPKRTRTDITYATILETYLGLMKPEVGNLTWASQEFVAERTGVYSRDTIQHYLQAAQLIGDIIIKYRTAKEAHAKVSRVYPDYTSHTYGKTFPELIKAEVSQQGRVKPKLMNFATFNPNGPSFKGECLADWMIEVIRLCATQSASNVKKAQELAAKHRIMKPKPGKRNKVVDHPGIEPEPILNDMVRPIVSAEPEPENGILNDGVDPTEEFLSGTGRGPHQPTRLDVHPEITTPDTVSGKPEPGRLAAAQRPAQMRSTTSHVQGRSPHMVEPNLELEEFLYPITPDNENQE